VGVRRNVSIAVGLTQSIIGALATIFAYLLYHNFLGIQTMLNVPSKDVILFMLVLIVFGLLSIISGLFLVNKK
jgi:ABC-type Na+ efflux pump permease subunit